MALNTVTLTWDFTDLIQSGQSATLVIVPTAQEPDATDGLIVAAVARPVAFTGGTGQLAGIIANDNANIPAGTGYTITVTSASGQVIYSQTVVLNFAAGATQKLSSLTPATVGPVVTTYMLQPAGTPQAGQVPVASGAGEASAWGTPPVLPAAPAGFSPANPASTVSGSLVMMGLGSVCTYTPASSGLVLANIACYAATSTGLTFVNLAARYGTGAAPANGVAVTGTRLAGIGDPQVRGSGINNPAAASWTGLLALTPGTAYWFDLALASGSVSDPASIANVMMTLAELR